MVGVTGSAGLLRGLTARAMLAVERSTAALWLTVFLPVLMLYLSTLRVNGADMITDTVSVTSSAWELAHHGTPRIPDHTHVWGAWIIQSGAGHVISNREPGLIGLAAVFYFLFHSASILDVTPASIAAALVTAAAVAFIAVIARRLVSGPAAVVVGLLVGTGTTMWAVAGTSLFPHGPDALYLALAILAVAGGRFTLAGVAIALAILTRPPLGVAAVVFAVWFAIERRSIKPALGLALPCAAGVAGYLAYSHEFWGGGLQAQYQAATGADYTGRLFDVGPHAWADFAGNIVGSLVSPGRGILVGSPFLIVLAFGLRPAWRVAPSWVRAAAIGGLVYIAVQLKINRFQGGSPFWSYRYPIELLALAAPLLVLAWREYVVHTQRRKAAFVALGVASVAYQTIGACCFRSPPGATIVWNFTDLGSAISDHPVLTPTLLILGGLGAMTAYWRIGRGNAAGHDEPATTRA